MSRIFKVCNIPQQPLLDVWEWLKEIGCSHLMRSHHLVNYKVGNQDKVAKQRPILLCFWWSRLCFITEFLGRTRHWLCMKWANELLQQNCQIQSNMSFNELFSRNCSACKVYAPAEQYWDHSNHKCECTHQPQLFQPRRVIGVIPPLSSSERRAFHVSFAIITWGP